ncbi:hypothetical protein PIB30_041478 [Stylosanthes scabra]|uniref:Uncharacterized protein n=1 Tax=Stylosanthes scabra TaxID=79078 RepID=A0ABU6RFE2_9FABA|nr:hypothetical protein [Stylosanthes scabra]
MDYLQKEQFKSSNVLVRRKEKDALGFCWVDEGREEDRKVLIWGGNGKNLAPNNSRDNCRQSFSLRRLGQVMLSCRRNPPPLLW